MSGEAQAINAALGRSYDLLRSARMETIEVTVEDVDVALDLADRMRLNAEAVDDTTIAILVNHPAREKEVAANGPANGPAQRYAELLEREAELEQAIAAVLRQRRTVRHFWIAVAAWGVALLITLVHGDSHNDVSLLAGAATVPLMLDILANAFGGGGRI